MARTRRATATATSQTNLSYEYPARQSRGGWVLLADKAERALPEGSRIACRLDPENPDFIVSVKDGMPWTKTKLTFCVILILLGGLIMLASLAAGSK